MTYITFATMLLLAAGAVCSLYRQLQMLHSNEYLLSKYFKWVWNHYVTELAISAVIYCATMFFVLNSKDIFALVLSILLLAARIALNILTHKKSTEKLAFSARIKRLYIIAIVILGILLFISAISFGNVTKVINIVGGYLINNNMTGEIVRTICILLSSVTPVLTVVIWFINCLIEKVTAKCCKKSAKHDLKVKEEKVESAIDPQEETDPKLEYENFIDSYLSTDDDDSEGAKL